MQSAHVIAIEAMTPEVIHTECSIYKKNGEWQQQQQQTGNNRIEQASDLNTRPTNWVIYWIPQTEMV